MMKFADDAAFSQSMELARAAYSLFATCVTAGICVLGSAGRHLPWYPALRNWFYDGGDYIAEPG
jgi:hypothetical protein